ncbi:hypothetical protein [Campylobacter sp. RM16189]|uniref:hypothetical protein n=1 Tax=Campylobacter sp. RM16189 TaxID=1705726 RepID=UPI001474EC43|nr:hypothetical protein [Campylobacter sp. RM16189]
MAKKQAIKKLPAYKKITEDDLKILYAIKKQMLRDREENISPQQKMLIQVSDFIIDSNKDKLTATMISKALREIGVSIGTRSIKSFLLSRGQEPYRKVKNQAQKIAKNEAIKEVINEPQKVEIKEAQIEDEKEVSNADVKEVKKDDSVIGEDEMKKLEEKIKNIENDESISAVKKHEKINNLKDSSIAALKNQAKYPHGRSKEEYEKSVTIDPEIAAEGRAKKKIIGG